MRRWVFLGLAGITGCSTVPVADVLDTFFPSHIPQAAPVDGSPVAPTPMPAAPPVTGPMPSPAGPTLAPAQGPALTPPSDAPPPSWPSGL
jgi:hypothetical protein